MGSDNAQLKSEQVLESIRQKQHSKEIVDVEMELVKLVVFVSGGSRYGFYGSDIREIIPASAISWVPGLPGYLPGLINVRGDIESVIDLHYFLGTETHDTDNSLIAMAVYEGFRSGVLIDSIDDVMDVPVSSIKPPLTTLNGTARDLVTGEIEYKGELITLLDIEKLAAKVRL
jgi:purine-binding chemotaxis protein CheW